MKKKTYTQHYLTAYEWLKHVMPVVIIGLLIFMYSGSAEAFDFNSTNEGWTRAGLYDGGSLTPIPGYFSVDPAPHTMIDGSPNPGAIMNGSGGFTFPPSPTGDSFLHWDLNSPNLSSNSQWQGISSFSYAVTGSQIATLSNKVYIQAVLHVKKPDMTESNFSDGIFHPVCTAGDLSCTAGWETHTVNVASLGMPAGTTILDINLRIFFKPGTGHDGFVLVDHVVPTTAGGGSCQNKCGQGDVGGCYCDSNCVNFGDCCSDYIPECGGINIVGTWDIYFDVDCNGSPGHVEGYFHADGTYTNAAGDAGTWTLIGNQLTINLSAFQTTFVGTVTGTHMEGTFIAGAQTGCWWADTGGSSGSCQGKCGQGDVGGCYCDSACANYGDCCSDYVPECGGGGGSCQGKCGQGDVGGCYCDSACANYGDCCPDYQQTCSGPAPDSCEGRCGGQAPAGCWCDSGCAGFGDCCSDKVQKCG